MARKTVDGNHVQILPRLHHGKIERCLIAIRFPGNLGCQHVGILQQIVGRRMLVCGDMLGHKGFYVVFLRECFHITLHPCIERRSGVILPAEMHHPARHAFVLPTQKDRFAVTTIAHFDSPIAQRHKQLCLCQSWGMDEGIHRIPHISTISLICHAYLQHGRECAQITIRVFQIL